jgi:RHS repeat-associated protein
MAGLGSAAAGTVENKYLYNGKEKEDDLFSNNRTLMWYHYGARYYDPQLGRWHSVDPADEFYSPYAYGPNDPINGLDPDGTEWILIDGEPVWVHIPGISSTGEEVTWEDHNVVLLQMELDFWLIGLEIKSKSERKSNEEQETCIYSRAESKDIKGTFRQSGFRFRIV